MSKQFFITEFWAGPDGHRELWHSEMTEADPTGVIRGAPPGQLFPGKPPELLIITYLVRQWAATLPASDLK